MRCAPIEKVVAIDRGDDHIAKFEFLDRLRKMRRLQEVGRFWLPMCHITEGAAPCANIPQNHEGSRPFGETFREVWARCLLADAVKLIFAENAFDVFYGSRMADASPDPGGLLDQWSRGINLDGDSAQFVGITLMCLWLFS